MNLTEFGEKCKSDRVFIPLIVILVGIGSFGLGRLSKIEALKQGISIKAPASVIEALNTEKQALNGNLEAINTDNGTENIQKIESATGQPRQNFEEQNLSGQVVASKSGTKYHYPWCAGAKSISEKNKIWFNSVEEAKKAGYTPASNCKGLK